MTKTTYPVSKGQLAKIHILIGQQVGKNDDLKQTMVSSFTAGRTTSTKELTWKEAQDLIKALSGIAPPAPRERKELSPEEQQRNDIKMANYRECDKKRKLLIRYAHQMGWELPDGKADLDRLNGWCIKYGTYHKPLMEHSSTELSHIAVQLEKAYKDYLKSV
jgi:hypothetical protein